MASAFYNQAAAALQDPRVNAFLDAVLRPGEGTAGAGGYNLIYGGRTFSDFSHHPHISVCAFLRTLGRTVCSDAAGAFQFLSGTWDGEVIPALGVPDFSPNSQRLGAVYLLIKNGSLAALQANDIVNATLLSRGRWPSLPGGSQSQSTRTMASVVSAWNNALGNAAPITPASTTTDVDATIIPDSSNATDLSSFQISNDTITVVAVGILIIMVVSWLEG